MYTSSVVARAIGLVSTTPPNAVVKGVLSASKKVLGTKRLVYTFSARDVAIWRRRSGMTYEQLMERCLKLAAELEERDGRTN